MDIPPKNTIAKEKDEKVEKTVKSSNTEKTKDQTREEVMISALDKVKQKGAVINAKELADNEARKGADANREVEKGKMSWIKKLWKHTFFDDVYRQKEINKVREDIKNTGDIYAGRKDNTDAAAHENTMKAITDRFTSDYEGTLSDGEEKKMLDDKDPDTLKAKTDLKNLLNNYAMEIIDEETFRSGKDTIIKSLKNEDLLKGADNYADNLFEIAQNARLALQHGATLKDLDYDLDIVIGKAKSSIKTEAHFNMIDKAVDWTKKSPVGKFISPAVLSTSIALAYSLTVGLSKKIMRSKAAAVLSLGGSVAVSALFAGANESYMVARERANNDVKFVEGGKTEEGDKRREQLDRYKYTMESSNVLAQNLRDLMYDKDKDGKDVLKDIKQEDVDKIIASLSEIDARKSLNASNKIDLISYSGIGAVEKESTDLTILTARAKAELTKKLEAGLKAGVGEKEFESLLAQQTQVVRDSLLGGEKGITARDKAFSKYKAGRIAKKMAATAIGGLIIGGTIQEIMAVANPNVQGLAEGMFHHDVHATVQTPFESIRGFISGNPSHMGMGHAITAVFNGHNINIPEGTSLVNNADGTFDLLRGGNVVSSHFLPTFNASGELDAASISRLGQDGIMVSTTHQIIDSTKEVTGSAKDWMHNHPGETIKVRHDAFMDQNSPMVPDPAHPGHLIGADGNEPLTQWGGIHGTGINAKGDAVMNISHMTSDASYHGNISVNVPEEVAKGNVIAIIYPNGGGEGIPVPVGTNGEVIFDHNNPIMQQIFRLDAKGHMVSHAKVIEFVQKMGVDAKGFEHVRSLSAVVGEGMDKIKDIIPSHEDVAINGLSPTMDVENPLFVTAVARRTVGKAIYENGEEIKPTEKGPIAIEKTGVTDMKAIGEGDGVKQMKAIGEGMGAKKEPLAISQFSVGNEFGRLEAKEANKKAKVDLARAANDMEVFKSAHPGEKIPVEMEEKYKEAEANLINSKATLDKAEEEHKKELDKQIEAAKKTATSQATAPDVKRKPVVVKKTTPGATLEPVVTPGKTPDNSSSIEKKFTVDDLSKGGTEIESETGKFTVTEKIKKPGFWSFNAFEVKGIFKDKNGTESIVSYDLKEMERLFKKNILKITKVEEKSK